MAKSNKQRFGVFYKSHGSWTGPYMGATFTKYTVTRRPVTDEVDYLRKFVLKSPIQIRPVKTMA